MFLFYDLICFRCLLFFWIGILGWSCFSYNYMIYDIFNKENRFINVVLL